MEDIQGHISTDEYSYPRMYNIHNNLERLYIVYKFVHACSFLRVLVLLVFGYHVQHAVQLFMVTKALQLHARSVKAQELEPWSGKMTKQKKCLLNQITENMLRVLFISDIRESKRVCN